MIHYWCPSAERRCYQPRKLCPHSLANQSNQAMIVSEKSISTRITASAFATHSFVCCLCNGHKPRPTRYRDRSRVGHDKMTKQLPQLPQYHNNNNRYTVKMPAQSKTPLYYLDLSTAASHRLPRSRDASVSTLSQVSMARPSHDSGFSRVAVVQSCNLPTRRSESVCDCKRQS